MSRGDRRKPYKIDSTRGKCIMEPRTYKGDVLTQVWIDARVLATLSEWLDGSGQVTRFMSEVVKIPLAVLVEHLTESGEAEMIDDTVVARDMLVRKYRVNLNPDERGGKNILHNIQLSDRRKSLGDRLIQRQRVEIEDVSVPVETVREVYEHDYSMPSSEEIIAYEREKARIDFEKNQEKIRELLANANKVVDEKKAKPVEVKQVIIPSEQGNRKMTEEEIVKANTDREIKDRMDIERMNKELAQGPKQGVIIPDR